MAETENMKKRRAFNFTHDELEALVVAVEERKPQLFGKFTPTLTAQIKEKKWQEVTEAVAAVCGVQRTLDSIKKKWSTLASEAKARGALIKRDQAKTGAGVTEVKPLTALEEKILAVMGQVYTEGISTGTEVGLGEVLDRGLSESTQVILTLMDPECDSRTLPPATIIPSPAKKRKQTCLQEELLELEKEKLKVMQEQLKIERERLQLEKDKFEFMKDCFIRGRDFLDLHEA